MVQRSEPSGSSGWQYLNHVSNDVASPNVAMNARDGARFCPTQPTPFPAAQAGTSPQVPHPSWGKALGLAPFYRWEAESVGVLVTMTESRTQLSRSLPPTRAPRPGLRWPLSPARHCGASYLHQECHSTPYTPSPSRICCHCPCSPRR